MSEDFNQEETARFEDELIADAHGLSAEEQSAVEALPDGNALLIVTRGPNVGARFLLDSDSTIAGRHPNADIFLDDVTVSRKHVEFKRVDGEFELIDLGSLNGSYMLGQRVDRAPLRNGSDVQIGKFKMTFYSAPNKQGGSE
jgi:pSer/pThr/pTyr-binding forkhead associated (FHA) protein